MTETEYWAKLDEIGWLDHIEESNVAKIRQHLKKNLKRGVKGAHLALAQFEFEPGDQSLTEFLQTLEEESRGLLKVAKVKETDELFSFHVGKDRYACEIDGDEEFRVIDLVNKCLRKNQAPQFIVLPGGDGYVPLVFLPLEVFQRAVDAKLIEGAKVKSAEVNGTFQFVLARDEDSHKSILTHIKSKRWPDVVAIPEINSSALGDLLGLLVGKTQMVVEPFIQRSDMGPNMFEITSAGIAALESIASNKVGAVVKKWIKVSLSRAHSDEMTTEMLSDRVWDLCNLARAKASGERLIGQLRL